MSSIKKRRKDKKDLESKFYKFKGINYKKES
jgi:hypothetical protein